MRPKGTQATSVFRWGGGGGSLRHQHGLFLGSYHEINAHTGENASHTQLSCPPTPALAHPLEPWGQQAQDAPPSMGTSARGRPSSQNPQVAGPGMRPPAPPPTPNQGRRDNRPSLPCCLNSCEQPLPPASSASLFGLGISPATPSPATPTDTNRQPGEATVAVSWPAYIPYSGLLTPIATPSRPMGWRAWKIPWVATQPHGLCEEGTERIPVRSPSPKGQGGGLVRGPS